MKNISIRNQIQKGSATIELTLLMPCIIGIIILVIYTALFLYNREAVQSVAYICALKGAQMEDEGQNTIQKQVEKLVKTQTNKKLPFVSEWKQNVDVSLTKVSVELQIKQKMPFSSLLQKIGVRNYYSYKVKKSVRRLTPITFIWEVDRF